MARILGVGRSSSDFYASFERRPFKSITDLEKEEDGQFDVVGQVIACEDLDNYDKNGKAGKKTRAMRLNARCEAIMPSSKMCIQNGYWGTKLYLFDGNKAISEDEYKKVEEFRQRLFANQPSEQSENIATKISTASKNSTKDNFVNMHRIRNIVELLDVEHVQTHIPYSKLPLLDIFGTVIAIQEDEGWWYLGCRACRGKVIKSTDYVDLESEMPKKPDGPNNWFRLHICVQDETRTMSLSLFNDGVQAMVGRSAYQLCEKYAKSESDGSIPTEIANLIGNKYAFKVAIDDYNVKKLLPVFIVLRFSNDQEIINSVLACATPIKDNEATSNTVLANTLLDLESQTDENTTPNEKQKTNKRPAEGEPGSKSSTRKKKAVKIKVEKDA
ncbi:replication protein A 70 kDa DNA-binding subunit B [Tanacetum coccineum]